MASVKLVLRTHQEDATGHSPLYIRVIKDRKTKFITAGVKLKLNEWDEEKQRVKKNHTNSARMNAALMQKLADAEGQVADLERKRKSVSIKKLKDAIKGKEIPNFFEYAYARIEKTKGNVSYRTYDSYFNYVKKFETFLGSKDVYFDDITVTTLNDYVSYMGTVSKNGATTQHYSLKILSIIFKDAQREDVIPETLYPFSKIKIKKDKGKRLFLNKDQVEQLSNLEINQSSKGKVYRDMFIFSIYAGGLRFSDVITLQVKHFNKEEHRIKKLIRKTNRVHQFKIGATALNILEQYIKPNASPDDFIFPIIDDKDFEKKTEEYQFNVISKANQNSTFYLRSYGKKMNLQFNLSFHLSRHTFATNALNNGMRIEHVSKLLDHTDISTTQIYAKIISEELDKAVEAFVN